MIMLLASCISKSFAILKDVYVGIEIVEVDAINILNVVSPILPTNVHEEKWTNPNDLL